MKFLAVRFFHVRLLKVIILIYGGLFIELSVSSVAGFRLIRSGTV